MRTGDAHVGPQARLDNRQGRRERGLGRRLCRPVRGGTRRLKTFDKKKDADDFAANANVEVRAGIHTADSASITIAEAGKLWIETGEAKRLGALDGRRLSPASRSAYRALSRHGEALATHRRRWSASSRTSSPAATCRTALRPQPRSPAMVRKIRVVAFLAAQRRARARPCRRATSSAIFERPGNRGKERRAERRQKGKLKIGVDIPDARGDQGHRGGRARAAGGRPADGDLHRPPRLELRGLRWEDVDLEKRELHVRQRADRYSEIGKPKSESGERTVPLTPIVVNTLREWKLACPKSEAGLVFPSSGGIVEHHSNIVIARLGPDPHRGRRHGRRRRGRRQPIERAKYTGLHALRHFYASWCINRRVDGGLELPAKVVQERLGHSSIVMTLDVYGHLFARRRFGGIGGSGAVLLLA